MSGRRSSLERDIRDWDGKSADAIQMVYDAYSESSDFVDQLISMLVSVDLQDGATWLIKRYVEEHGRLGAARERALYRSASSLEPWGARLHVLQCIPHLPIPKASIDTVGEFVRDNLDSQKTFVRAWAYGALHALAERDARFEDEARRRFEKARVSESASVRARLRRLGVEGF